MKSMYRVIDSGGRDAYMEGENFGRPTYQYRQTYDSIKDARAVCKHAGKEMPRRAPFRIIRVFASAWEEVR